MSASTLRAAEWKAIALAGYSLIGITFGVAGGWAAVAKLDRAVIASGFVGAETNRKTVQHLEGGLVREILVKEGDRVAEGQVLFRLQEVQARANSDLAAGQLDAALALEARLLAERDGRDAIAWPPELRRSSGPGPQNVLADQQHQFDERRASLLGQTSILEARLEQLSTEIRGVTAEREATEQQVVYINEELVGLRELAGKQLIPLTRVFAMERERTRLEGAIGRAMAEAAKIEGSMGEIRVQIQQIRQKFQEEVAGALLEARQKAADLRERVAVAQDVLKRVDITAPRAGTVQNLKVFTVGQVLRPGETMIEIAPEDEQLVVNAQFATTDIDVVHAGMTAEIRFPAFQAKTIPVMMGKLESISNDRLLDDITRQYYYLGVISLNRADIPDEYKARIRPGMPAEVIISAGERTVLSYLISPLEGSLRKSLREH